MDTQLKHGEFTETVVLLTNMRPTNSQLSLLDIQSDTSNKSSINTDDIKFIPDFLDKTTADMLFSKLKEFDGWRQDSIKIYGKTHPLPRLNCWFATSQEPYKWSGIEMKPIPFTDELKPILERITNETNTNFNTALGNLYRNGKDSVSWHSDDEPDLGRNPVIASLSLGETRRFLLRQKKDHSITKSFDLTHGSLLYMSGNVQNIWEHSIPKTTKDIGIRINLTFRAIYK